MDACFQSLRQRRILQLSDSSHFMATIKAREYSSGWNMRSPEVFAEVGRFRVTSAICDDREVSLHIIQSIEISHLSDQHYGIDRYSGGTRCET